jgi:L-threonylcarbamoyladenylate synthase
MTVLDAESLSEREFDLILSVLRAGDVIAFPTDTSYGLGADPYNEEGISRIFTIKGRPETKPILLLVDSLQMTERVALPNPLFPRVAEAFWPGPLTLILPARSNVPGALTAGTGTVGVRWPKASFAIALLTRLRTPITATSANRSGRQSSITASEVRMQFGGELPLIVDGGELPARSGSTLLDLTCEPPVLLREGPIHFDELNAFFEGNIRRAAE